MKTIGVKITAHMERDSLIAMLRVMADRIEMGATDFSMHKHAKFVGKVTEGDIFEQQISVFNIFSRELKDIFADLFHPAYKDLDSDMNEDLYSVEDFQDAITNGNFPKRLQEEARQLLADCIDLDCSYIRFTLI